MKDIKLLNFYMQIDQNKEKTLVNTHIYNLDELQTMINLFFKEIRTDPFSKHDLYYSRQKEGVAPYNIFTYEKGCFRIATGIPISIENHHVENINEFYDKYLELSQKYDIQNIVPKKYFLEVKNSFDF